MTEYRPRFALVTGGAGFIGSNFVRHWLEVDKTVEMVTLDKLSYAGCMKNLADLPHPNRHTFIRGDICDAQLVAALLRQYTIDAIVHFAAESHVDRSIAGPAPFIQSNLVGTFTLLDAARSFWLDEKGLGPSACRFHHVSTDEVFGSLGPTDPPFREGMPYCPNSPYSASKAGSDHLVHAYHHTYGLPVTITNCSNNYGPYQHPEKFIPVVIHACLNQQPIPVYGDGSNIRDWLYVEDHCRGIIQAIVHGQNGHMYNLAGQMEQANIDIARLICSLMDELRPEDKPHERLITFVTDRPGHDWRYAMDISKVTSELGWTPSVPFEDGIRRTIRWFVRT